MQKRLLICLTLASIFTSGTALAASFKCESKNERRAECAAPSGGQIRLERQISKASCIEGRTWGRSGNGVYVSDGCRAIFSTDDSRSYTNPDHQPSGRREIVNELEQRPSERREIENQLHQRDRGLPAPTSRGGGRGRGHADMVGERQIVAQNELIARGYDLRGSRDGSDRRWTYFRTPSRDCLQVIVIQGRFSRIDSVNDRECSRGDLRVIGRGNAGNDRGYDDRDQRSYDDRDQRDSDYRDYDDRDYDDRRGDDRYRDGRGYQRRDAFDDLIGARASSAKSELHRRGYVYVRTERRRRSEWVYFESDDRRRCLRATHDDGRYREIVERDRSDCR